MATGSVLSTAAAVWSLIGAAGGFGAKVMFDTFIKHRQQIALETWKVRVRVLEERLSKFYWPLYSSLKRDELLWEKVFLDLREERENAPDWAQNLPDDVRLALSKRLERDVILPAHAEAVRIIRENIHRSNADAEFLGHLGAFVRHVDVYTALRSANLDEIDPLSVGEPYPDGLGGEVEKRLKAFQDEYEDLLRAGGILDLRDVRLSPKVRLSNVEPPKHGRALV